MPTKETPKKKPRKNKQLDLMIEHLKMLQVNPENAMLVYGWTEEEYNKEVEELQNKITLSRRGKSNRLKGNSYENIVAKKFQEAWGILLKRTPKSGGYAKTAENRALLGDLTCLDEKIDFQLHIECKDCATWRPLEWISQAEYDCPKDRFPIVVAHRRQKVKQGKVTQQAGDYVIIKFSDFLKIADAETLIQKVQKLKKRRK